MSAESTLDHASRKRLRRNVQVLLAIFGVGVLFVAVFLWQILERSQRYKQITVGMTVDEVVDLMGETSRHSIAGEPLNPPVVTVPAGTAYEYAYTWFIFPAKFVYVLFDEEDRVVAIYTYDS